MKKKLSVTIDAQTVDQIEAKLPDGTYRNKSHMIEFALKKLLGVKK